MLETHDPARTSAAVAAGHRRPFDLHLRQPLLQRRQPGERDGAGLFVLQLGHPRVRHSRSGSTEGNRLLQPGFGFIGARVEPRDVRPMARRRARLVRRKARLRLREKTDRHHVSGQRLAGSAVRPEHLAFLDQHGLSRPDLRRKVQGFGFTLPPTVHFWKTAPGRAVVMILSNSSIARRRTTVPQRGDTT